MGVGGDFPHFAKTAGGEHGGFAVEYVCFAGAQLNSHNPIALVAVHDDVNHLKFIKKLDIVFNTVLVQCLQDHVAGAVGSMAGPLNSLLGLGVGMSAKAALANFAIGGAVEWQPHVF